MGALVLWFAAEDEDRLAVPGGDSPSSNPEIGRRSPRPDPDAELKGASRKRETGTTVRVSKDAVISLAARMPGEKFELALGSHRYQAVMESWTDDGEVATFGVRLSEPVGRFQGTLRSDGRLRAEVFFDGKAEALSLSDAGETGEWLMRSATLADLMCVPQGTTYKTAGGAALDPTPPPPPEVVPKDVMAAPPLLNSLPGASYVLYCDFDGETVTHSKWNSGNTIVAQPHPNANDQAFVTRVWRRVAEDFSPFAINVTTDRAVFNATPVARRVHCIITPTDTATPGSGGVAYLNSFGDGTPCWTFNQSEFSCADTISHEVGHTLGLSHDGRTGGDAYYGGHGTGVTSWAPIMGAAWSDEGTSYTEHVTQWSKGEYANANNTQDDLAIIAGAGNGFGYRADDKGSTRAAATAMVFSNGVVSDSGIIERTTDEDWLRFTTSGGAVSLQVGVVNVQSTSAPQAGANLAVALQIVDSAGTVLQSSNPTTTMGASIAATVAAGTYYLRIEGVGRGTASTGFTDYGSLGQYVVTGTIPQSGTNSLAVSPATMTVPAAGGTYNIDVFSNTNWSWTDSAAWLTSSEASPQSGNQTFTFTIGANTGSSERTAVITFTAGSLTATHTVTQQGSVTDDHGNGTGTATVVNQNSSTPGNIETAGDNDYFRINVTGSGVLLVNTTGSTDTYGHLLNSAGVELAANDDSIGTNFRISYNVTAGTYYVRVRHYSSSGTGAYVLVSSFSSSVSLSVSPVTASVGSAASPGSFNVSSNAAWSWSSNAAWLTSGEAASQSGNQLFEYWAAANTSSSSRTGVITITSGGVTATHSVTQAGVSGDDHGNTIATATLISQNSTTSGVLSAGDEDYFRINVTGTGTLTVQTTGSTDTYGYLLNSSGTQLAANDDSVGTNFRIVHSVTAGTYYVRVRHYDSMWGIGSYQLASSFSTGSGDDHGDSVGASTLIAQNSTTAGNINHPGDNDYFRINITVPGTLTVGTTGSTDTYGYLLNSAGTQLASNDDTNGTNFSITYAVTVGTYYVRVTHYSSGGTGAYSLVSSLAAVPVPEIAVEDQNGNGLTDGASAVAFGSVNRGQSVTRVFTVRNVGTATLSGIAVSFSGGNVADFSVTAAPLASVSAGSWTTFTVRFAPGGDGARTTALRVASNDADENPFDIVLTGTGVPVPEIAIEYPSGTGLTDGVSSVGFGSVNEGASLTRTFTVRNLGTAPLTGVSVGFSGGNTGDFSVSTVPAASVSAGGSTTFVITFSPGGAGARTTSMRVASNDADENPFDITLTGTGVAVPEIEVIDNTGPQNLTDGVSTVALGSIDRGSSVTRTFTVRNTGGATLSGISVSFSGGNTGDFTTTASPAASVAAGGSTSFTIRFAPGGSGTRTTTLRVASNDSNENPFDIALTGTGVPVPEIAVEYPSGTGLTDGASTVGFGSVNRGSTLTRTFTVRNVGTASLTGISAGFSGGDAGDFTVTTAPAASVSAGSSTTFVVTFAPGDSGARTTTLRIANNDADENPFDVTLTGTGVPVPEIEVVDAISSVNLIDGSGTVALGSVNRGSSVTRTFTVRNVGTAPLTGVAASFNGGSASDYTVLFTPDATVAPGGSTAFTIRFTPSAAGGRNTTLRVASNDANENPFDIGLTATGVSVPEISVEQPVGTVLTDGASSVDYGTVQIGQNASRTFTVRNVGTASLTGVGVSFSGGNTGDFSVTASPSGTVNAGSSTTFTVRLAPSAMGVRTTTLRIASNDADENPFDILLSGGPMTPRQMFDAMAGGSGLSGTQGEPGAIPHGDGVKNLLKYAFNMNLGGADSRILVAGSGTAGLPSVQIEGVNASRMIKVEFLRRKGSGLTYVAKVSGTLSAGSFTPMTGTPVVTSIDATWERVVIRDPATAGRNFAVVEVTVP